MKRRASRFESREALQPAWYPAFNREGKAPAQPQAPTAPLRANAILQIMSSGRRRSAEASPSRPAFHRPSPIASARNRSGFTLLEILIALAIFVGAAAALSRLLVIGLENAEFADFQGKALMLAESRWAEFQAGLLTVDDAGTYQADDEGYPGWQWTFSAETGDVTGLYKITILIENVSDGPAKGISLTMVRMWLDDAAISEEDSTSGTTL